MLSETIAELERLEKAATSAPWCVDDHIVNPDDADGSWHVFEEGEDDPPLMSTDLGTKEDALLVALLRTHARALLTAAKLSEARGRVCEAAKRVQEITYRRDRDEMENAAAGMTFSIGVLADARQELDTALAALAAAEEEPA